MAYSAVTTVQISRPECLHKDCPRHPSHGVQANKRGDFCAEHAEAGMVFISKEWCTHEGCYESLVPGVDGVRSSLCPEHARAGMVGIKLEVKRCAHEGCSGTALIRDFCGRHANNNKAEMIRIGPKRCSFEGCPTRPSYGTKDSATRAFCVQHAGAGMVYFRKSRCSYEGCSTASSYGMKNSTRSVFCARHADAGMVYISTRACGHEGCSTGASYGMPGTGSVRFCSRHAQKGMMNLKHKRCARQGCNNIAKYNRKGNKSPEVCFTHADVGMVNSFKKWCVHESCSKAGTHGVKGSGKWELCALHAEEGMVKAPDVQCCRDGCSNLATHGRQRRQCCAYHALEGMKLIARRLSCAHEGCLAGPSYGVKGNRRPEFCSHHAKDGMINVSKAMCKRRGCPKSRVFGVAGSRTREFCVAHAQEGMVNINIHQKNALKGYPKTAKRDDLESSTNTDVCTQDAKGETAYVERSAGGTGACKQKEDIEQRSGTEGVVRSVGGGAKRKADVAASCCATTDAGRGVEGITRAGKTPRPTPLQPAEQQVAAVEPFMGLRRRRHG